MKFQNQSILFYGSFRSAQDGENFWINTDDFFRMVNSKHRDIHKSALSLRAAIGMVSTRDTPGLKKQLVDISNKIRDTNQKDEIDIDWP